MDKLRTPLFFIALALIGLVVLVEVGSKWLPKAQVVASDIEKQLARPEFQGLDKAELQRTQRALGGKAPPGLGIPRMAWLDGLVAFTALLMGLPFLLSDRVQGRIVGLTSVIVSLLVLIGAIVLIFATLFEVLLMFGLFTAVPFGTIAYLAKWGFFDRSGAALTLFALLFLKLAFVVCLVLAQQRFVQNKGLVMILITSLLGNLIISFLHALVPLPLVSITDGVAALIVLILAAIWALLMLIFGIISVIKAIL